MHEEKQSFFAKDWVVILSLLLFPPFGIILLWKYKKFGEIRRIIYTILSIPISIFTYFALGIGILMFISSFDVFENGKESTKSQFDSSQSEGVEKNIEIEELDIKEREAIRQKEKEVQEQKDKEQKAIKQKEIDDAENTYFSTMDLYSEDFSLHSASFSELNSELEENPTLMLTEEWVQDAAVSLLGMKSVIPKILAVVPPKNLKDYHNHFLEAMDEYTFIINNFPNAIDNFDTDLYLECNEARIRAIEHLSKANETLRE